MSSKTNNENTIIIFHRCKQNAQESLTNQQTFLESHKEQLINRTVINYPGNDYFKSENIRELIKKNSKEEPSKKVTIIMQSHLSQEEHDNQFDMYLYFHFLKIIDMADLYLMDHEGRLYREIEETIF